MSAPRQPGERTISIGAFLTIYGVLVVVLLLIGGAYPEARFRIEAHEQAHLKAYHLQGIEAERTSFSLVTSAALTNLGALAGYRRDIAGIVVAALLSALLAGFLYVSWRRSPFLSVLPVWSVSAWVGIRGEMLLPALDIRNAAQLSGQTTGTVTSAMTIWAIVLIVDLLTVCFLSMTWPALQSANNTGRVEFGQSSTTADQRDRRSVDSGRKKSGRWGSYT